MSSVAVWVGRGSAPDDASRRSAARDSRQYLDAKIKTWVEYLRGSLPEILAAHQAELTAYELSGSLGGARLST